MIMVLEIVLHDQKAYLRQGSTVLGDYPISSSKFGIGFEEGSFKTPLGRFKIHEILGLSSDPLTIFRARSPVGTWDKQASEKDLILSRIIWLDGLETDNKNTKDRHIYIHGTNQEDLIGTPASWGCIRLKNKDIIHLCSVIQPDTEIVIRS